MQKGLLSNVPDQTGDPLLQYTNACAEPYHHLHHDQLPENPTLSPGGNYLNGFKKKKERESLPPQSHLTDP